MFTLPILPDEIAVPLDHYEVEGEKGKPPVTICEYPGVTAYVKPFDVEAASRWNDAIFGENPEGRSIASTALVLRHLTRIEGLNMADAKDPSKVVPFDVKNDAHKRSIPMKMRDAIYLAIRKRAELPAVTEKNFASPSVSGGTSVSANTPADPAASAPATS